MFMREPKYIVGDKWYAGPKCNGYKKGTILKILDVIGFKKNKKLLVTDKDGNRSVISYKALWKKCKKGSKDWLISQSF